MRYFKFIVLVITTTLVINCSTQQSTTQDKADVVSEKQSVNTVATQPTKNTATKAESKSISTIETKQQKTLEPKNTPVEKTKPSTSPSVSQNTVVTSAANATPSSIKTVKAQASVKGKITLQDSTGNFPSSEGAIIELKKLASSASIQPSSHKNHIIDTRSKTYIPGYLTVKVGDTLVFKNNDSIKHNVFSSSGKNTFDLGTYGYNREKNYTVAHDGIIKVYCNIHPEMALFVSASQDNLSFITDKSGNYSIQGIEPGKYKLSVWHLRGSTEKIIEIKVNETKIENLTIDISSYKPEPRVNKHGEAYKKQPAIFKDEFY